MTMWIVGIGLIMLGFIIECLGLFGFFEENDDDENG